MRSMVTLREANVYRTVIAQNVLFILMSSDLSIFHLNTILLLDDHIVEIEMMKALRILLAIRLDLR